jgi:hypothetical protein
LEIRRARDPSDARPVLPVVVVVRDVGDLGPRADRLRVFPLHLPGRLRQAEDLGLELGREVGADHVLHVMGLAPPEDGLLIEGAVGAQAELRNPLGQVGHRLFQRAHIPTARGDVPVAELVVEDDVLLGPQHHHRLVAPGPVVGHRGRLLVALDERRIDVQGRGGLRRRVLEPGYQRAVRGPEADQGGRLCRDRGRGAGLPQR